jgi:hypothetical protein
MQYFQACKWIAISLLLSLSGCSDETQFAPNAAPAGSNDTKKIIRDADAMGRTEEFGPNSEVPESVDEEVAGKVADIATNPTQMDTDTSATASQIVIEKFQRVCSQGTKKTLSQRIQFPEKKDCRWNQAGNLGRRDAFLQAMEAQTTSISLPNNAQLCGISVNSEVSTIQYDDFMVLTLNGYVLMSSNKTLLQGLEGSSSRAFKWDFTRVRGSAADFNSPAYCLGTSSSICKIPDTDTLGKFQIKVDPTSLIHLANQVVDNKVMNFALIATGDNDDRDCYHTELNLDFTLQYVETQ